MGYANNAGYMSYDELLATFEYEAHVLSLVPQAIAAGGDWANIMTIAKANKCLVGGVTYKVNANDLQNAVRAAQGAEGAYENSDLH